jgi:hypothetical protein
LEKKTNFAVAASHTLKVCKGIKCLVWIFFQILEELFFFITSACFTYNSRSQILRFLVYKKEEVHFWPSNYSQSLVLAIEPENQKSLAIQLLKPFISDHRVVLASGFDDVAATWRWGPHVKLPPLSFFSPLFSLCRLQPLTPARTELRRRANSRVVGAPAPRRESSVDEPPPTGRAELRHELPPTLSSA